MELVYTIFAYGWGAVVAVLGMFVTLKHPQSRRGIYGWLAVFAIVGAVSVLDARNRDQRLRDMVLGGDNYGYLRAEVASAKSITDKVPLWLETTGLIYGLNIWIAPYGVTDPNDRRYYSLAPGKYYQETRGGHRIGKALPAGKYLVDLPARNGFVYQILEIKPVHGKLVQNIEVFREDEGRIYAEGPDVCDRKSPTAECPD